MLLILLKWALIIALNHLESNSRIIKRISFPGSYFFFCQTIWCSMMFVEGDVWLSKWYCWYPVKKNKVFLLGILWPLATGNKGFLLDPFFFAPGSECTRMWVWAYLKPHCMNDKCWDEILNYSKWWTFLFWMDICKSVLMKAVVTVFCLYIDRLRAILYI